MNIYRLRLGTVLLICSLAAAPLAQAQDYEDTDPAAQQQQPASYSQAQLDQLTAPIALYPDALLGQILMASTYPLEVVEASRWLQNPNNAALQGDQLAAAMEQEPWDPSVKSLVATPQVLKMMDSNIQWTEQLGDAFLAQQAGISDSVQRLRQQAQARGTLTTTPQQLVETQGSEIVIEPQNPDIVYVPAYNPMVVYGPWAYASYPPYSFYPAGYSFGAALIGFGVGIAVVDGLWGWDHWDWRHHHIDIDNRRFAELNRGRPPLASGVWSHDPAHRGGVPYRNAQTRARFQGGASPEANRAFRGYAAPAARAEHASFAPQSRPDIRPQTIRPVVQNAPPPTPMQPRPQTIRPAPAAMPVQRPASPVFESFSRGPDVRAQSARGFTSRASAPAPAVDRGGGRPAADNNHGEHR